MSVTDDGTGTFTFIFSNPDGSRPSARLIANSSGSTLYGTASGGGSLGYGTLFAIDTHGASLTNVYTFTTAHHGTNIDGGFPVGLILSGDTLYGTTTGAGASGQGTLFAVNTNGTGFRNLHSFSALAMNSLGVYTNSDGASPSGLTLSGNILYGTAQNGGSSGQGTLFAVNTDGSGFTNLHIFAATDSSETDGAAPNAGLIINSSGNILYGTASRGGSAGEGTVFAINTNGAGFTNLHHFTASSFNSTGDRTNSDGTFPQAGLILSGSTLYGTASQGGGSGKGVVFSVNSDGSGFTNLHNFAAGAVMFGVSDIYTNRDGITPNAELILVGKSLYGTTPGGGSWGRGSIFCLNTNGAGFTNVHSFAAGADMPNGIFGNIYTNSDGIVPRGLVALGNTLYGTANEGGSSGVGTVYSLSFAPRMTITPSGFNVILSWPTSFAGFDYSGFILQGALEAGGSFASIPGQSPYTISMTSQQKFFRLSHQ